MADVFATLLVGIGIGICFGVALSSKKLRRKLRVDKLFKRGRQADEHEVKEKERSSDIEDEMEEVNLIRLDSFGLHFCVCSQYLKRRNCRIFSKNWQRFLPQNFQEILCGVAVCGLNNKLKIRR